MKNTSPSIHCSIHPSLLFFTNVNNVWLNIRTDNLLNNKLTNPIRHASKQPRNLQELPTRSKNKFFQCNQPCHKPRCKDCSHIDTKCCIKFENNVTISAAKADCDSQNVVYIFFAKFPNAVYVGETSNRFRFRLNNHKHSFRQFFSGYPVDMH